MAVSHLRLDLCGTVVEKSHKNRIPRIPKTRNTSPPHLSDVITLQFYGHFLNSVKFVTFNFFLGIHKIRFLYLR